jgi:DNA-binding protein H-NS
MPRSLSQIQKQIAKLEVQANAIKKKEMVGVVARIKEAIAFYGLTASDLGLAGGPRKGRATPSTTKVSGRKPRKAAVGKIKFRDGNGNAWTGHGRRPQWYVNAIAAGATPEQLMA